MESGASGGASVEGSWKRPFGAGVKNEVDAWGFPPRPPSRAYSLLDRSAPPIHTFPKAEGIGMPAA